MSHRGARPWPGPFPELRQELWAPRDPFFEDAAASGELLVARIRLLLLCFILVIQLLPGWDPSVHLVGVSLNLVALAWAASALALVARRYKPWMGVVSSLVDVSLVSAGLVVYLVMDRPHVAVNSRVLFEIYFLALGCASLRYDWRVCALAGVLAVAQYASLVTYAWVRWDMNDPRYAPYTWGVFSWNMEAARLVLLAAASLLSTTVVLRARRLRRLSTTDRLTGLHNRGVFDERLGEEAIRARRYGRPLTVAILDIDQFKRFNDSHGHAGGDAALVAVAETLRQSMRRSDVVARYGGEEFAMILPETAAEEAVGKLDSVRRAVDLLPLVPRKGDPPARITVSIGVASWPADGDDVVEVVALADARLYDAKRAGRNRVVGPGQAAAPVVAAGDAPA